MVYITPDGKVLQKKPWGFGSVVDIFWGTVEFVTLFFTSLFGLTNRGNQGGRSRGGSGSGGPGNGPGGPRRRGEIKTMEDIQDCSMPGGG